jgi:hypothetical protein
MSMTDFVGQLMLMGNVDQTIDLMQLPYPYMTISCDRIVEIWN